MSSRLWSRVADELNQHEYMTGIERTAERVRATAEVFTPTALVLEMLQYLDLDIFAPGRTVLDPACGDGQFLVAAKAVKVHHHGMSSEQAVRDLYGVDIMRDNVDLCRWRLGGGTIILGDALNPSTRLEGQTEEEYGLMQSLFICTLPGATRGGCRANARSSGASRGRRRAEGDADERLRLF